MQIIHFVNIITLIMVFVQFNGFQQKYQMYKKIFAAKYFYTRSYKFLDCINKKQPSSYYMHNKQYTYHIYIYWRHKVIILTYIHITLHIVQTKKIANNIIRNTKS